MKILLLKFIYIIDSENYEDKVLLIIWIKIFVRMIRICCYSWWKLIGFKLEKDLFGRL